MAVVTSLIGWIVISTWKKLFNGSYSSIISGSFIAGLLSVVFSSIAFVLEYAIGGTVAVPLGSVLIAMVSSHVLIGIGEGIITGLIVSLLLRVRSDLVYVNQNKEIKNNATSFYGIFILLILLLTLITPYASSSPDGLESVAESYGFNEESGIVLFLDDYGITNINNNFLSTVLSAVLGIVVIVGLFNIYIKVKNKN
jgi:cobalt/nickel transport system permease protein